MQAENEDYLEGLPAFTMKVTLRYQINEHYQIFEKGWKLFIKSYQAGIIAFEEELNVEN